MSKLAEAYTKEGKFVQVTADTKAFVYEKGKGEAVVCIHGVPASSFVYKQVVDGLAERNIRGIAFDLLGLGLSSRPIDADYSWTGLGLWCTELVKQMELENFHLVLHDIGGAIGCEMIHHMPNRVLSVTMLNTQITGLETFCKPFPMNVYTRKYIGEIMIRFTTPFLVKNLMHLRGVVEREQFKIDDARAWTYFLKYNDGGKSFLQVLRNFENTPRKEAFYLDVLRNIDIPQQIIWGINDLGLKTERYGYPLQKALDIYDFAETNGAHFLQIDYADMVVQKISQLIRYNYGRKRANKPLKS